jgi:hypothetical protein
MGDCQKADLRVQFSRRLKLKFLGSQVATDGGLLAYRELNEALGLAEQAVRFVVIDRLVTQGSRSEAGRHWLERIWWVMATFAQHGRSAFNFLIDSVQVFFHDQPAPSLLADTS